MVLDFKRFHIEIYSHSIQCRSLRHFEMDSISTNVDKNLHKTLIAFSTKFIHTCQNQLFTK